MRVIILFEIVFDYEERIHKKRNYLLSI